MDYEPTNNNQMYNPVPKNTFETTAIVLGLVSTVAICTGFSMPLGALGILFAVLAHRSGRKLSPLCKCSVIFSGISILVPACIIAFTLTTLPAQLSNPNSPLNRIYEQTYGMSAEEYFNEWQRIFEENALPNDSL